MNLLIYTQPEELKWVSIIGPTQLLKKDNFAANNFSL